MIEKIEKLQIPDLDRYRTKVLLITGVRVIFFFAILAITVIYQLKLSTFFNTESMIPLYVLLITAFTLNSTYLFYFESSQKIWQPTAFLFGFDAIFITALILITGVQQSIFLFLYLVNVILCGFVFQRKGAFVLALFTSACFSLLLILTPEVQGQNLYYSVGLNNLAFFAVAGLSGYLSEELNFVGTELNLRKRDIRALEDLNKIIVENISSGLISLSSDFKVTLSNKSALKILNETSILQKEIDTIFPGLKEHILNSTEKRIERRHKLPSGERLILGLSISPLLNLENQITGYIVIFQDLTEVVRLENAMRRQDKLAAVGKLAAGIAHEIRNPLASISGSIELLKSLLSLTTPEQNKLMDIMLKEISRLNLLITEFLEFVRPEDRKLDVCNVDGILGEVLDTIVLNTSLPKHVKQVRRLEAGTYIAGDRNKLKQVFLNLFINAYHAMADKPQGELKVETLNKDATLIIKVSDTGHGMTEATIKRLFEPFFTTKPKGTGLGLATAHKILEIHDAKIFVESHEGQGTEFTIQFHQIIKQGAKHHESQNTGS